MNNAKVTKVICKLLSVFSLGANHFHLIKVKKRHFTEGAYCQVFSLKYH